MSNVSSRYEFATLPRVQTAAYIRRVVLHAGDFVYFFRAAPAREACC